MKRILLIASIWLLSQCNLLMAQPRVYSSIDNAHSHNDYLQNVPFYTAYSARCASIEADIFLVDGELYVAHEKKDINKARTLKSLYLNPIRGQMKINGGSGYPDGKSFQLLIDLKTDYRETLKVLEQQLLEYSDCFDYKKNPSAVRVIISGSSPSPEEYSNYADFICFDGNPQLTYTSEQNTRVPMISVPFQALTKWNGLGRMIEADYDKVKSVIDKVHAGGKSIRFWGCPDTKTAWNTFIKLGVDYLNTDQPALLDNFLKRYPQNYYSSKGKFYEVYQPSYKSDGSRKKPKNVIVLISDGGAGQGQMWATATANGGVLNLMQMRNIGLLKTNPTNDYTTDSAGAGTALATGQKTRNRRIGTDSLGRKVENITEALAAKGVRTGIISNDGITGATPSAYYAHQPERDMGQKIAEDLLTSSADLVIAAPVKALSAEDSLLISQLRIKNIAVCNCLEQLKETPLNQRAICLQGDDYKKDFRLIEESFEVVTDRLSAGKKGFFVMIEGAKVDKGGHANDLYTVIDEYLSFDRLVGKALEYADRNGETLVLVLSDHETGGVTILDGDYETGTVISDFSTNDHTGIPTLLYAYGPGSQYFRGFEENTSLFNKILSFYR